MRQKEFLIISITIFLTIIAWLMADIYHISTTEKVKLISPKVLKPINVNIDTEIFKVLEERK
jgi:hypothetical protein